MIYSFELEMDDDTYIYGGLQFEAEYDENKKVFLEPYTRREIDITIKYYPSKHLFVCYNESDEIIRLVFTMTCWSDDFRDYTIRNNSAIMYDEVYHGRMRFKNKACDVDFNKFITENGL
jgi:hypothetical protein